MADFETTLDASLGLVYRLNILWNRCDYVSIDGNYDKWDNILDAIFRNLLYKEELVVVENEKGKIEKVKLSKKDVRVYNYVSKEVHKAKRDWEIVKRKYPSKSQIYRSRYFHSLQLKDVAIRKMMQKLKIYFKEIEKSPGTAAFGSFGKRR